MALKETPVLLLTGYLGSGKTTLLNHILNNGEGIRFAVIVNDIGEVNIDASLVQKGGIVGQDDSGDLVALQNGCICCTLQNDLIRQLNDIMQTGHFDYIVIEASGVCEPAPIAQTICAMRQMAQGGPGTDVAPRLDCIVTVVDALRMKSEFECGDSLTRKDLDEEDIENLLIEQIEFCDLILLNKSAEVTDKERGRLREIIRALQPRARIIECNYCDIPLRDLLNTGLFDFEQVATSATWVREIERHVDAEEEDHKHEHHHHDHHEHEHDHNHDHEHDHHHHDDDKPCEVCGHGHHHHHHHHHEGGETEEYGIGTYVYFRRRPFDFDKFDRFVNLDWPKNVIRAKGVVYFSHNRDMSVLFEQAGVQKKLTEAGYWYATAPEEDLKVLMAREPGLERDWDEKYGDRMEKIVFIGRNLDREAIAVALDACLADE